MVLLFEVSNPFQWRPKYRRYSHFNSVIWLWFRFSWLAVSIVEYWADLKVAAAMRKKDDSALKKLGADVCWIRRGDKLYDSVKLADGEVLNAEGTIVGITTGLDGHKVIKIDSVEVDSFETPTLH